MEYTRQTLLNDILDRYSQWYTTELCPPEAAPLVARADYHEHGTGYVLVRKAEMWSADRHEYTFFFSVPVLTGEIYDSCMKTLMDLGMPLVNPESGHMCTALSAVFLCDSVEEAAAKAAEKCRTRKSFQFSLKGWMEVHTAAVDLGKGTVVGNPVGRNTVKFLKSMLHPKRKTNLLKRIRSYKE